MKSKKTPHWPRPLALAPNSCEKSLGGSMRILIRAATLISGLLFLLGPAASEEWPNRPIKIIVSMAAGSGPDIICRLISNKLTAALGQQFVVENKPGGMNL